MKTRLFLAALGLFLFASAAVEAATLPRKAGEFAIPTPDGKQVLLSNYRGKVVVLTFILTTCPHCQKTTGVLAKLQQELGPRGFQVLETAIDPNAKEQVPFFVRAFRPPFPVGWNDQATAMEYLQKPIMLGLQMPTLMFIDKQGMIRGQYEGNSELFQGDSQEQNLRNQIEALLNEPAAGQAKGSPKKRSTK